MRGRSARALLAGASAALVVILAGCGYHVSGKSGKMPGGITAVSIPVFENRTRKPDIESIMTSAFTNEFLSTVEVRDSAAFVMTGVIREYRLTPVSYTKSDVNYEYRLSAIISLRITSKDDGRVIWEDADITDYEDFTVNTADVNATEEAEIAAFREIARDTARLTKEKMLEDF